MTAGADRAGGEALVREVRERSGRALAEIVGRRVRLKRQGREWSGLCPFHGEKTPSFTVSPGKGFYHCFGCGAHGDAIDFRREIDGLSFRDAVEDLAAEFGLGGFRSGGFEQRRRARDYPPPPPSPEPGDDDDAAAAARRFEAARRIWRASRPAAGTLVETYFRARGLSIRPPDSLRFLARLRHPDGGDWPAMIAPVQAADGALVGIHRTYLAPDGRGKAPVAKAKLMLGRCWGGAIRLTPLRPTLIVAEGIETGASALELVAGAGCAVWAAGSLNNLAGVGLGRGRPHPDRPGKRVPSARPDPERPGLIVPPGVREIVLIEDSDGDRPTGRALVDRAGRRWRAAGYCVRRVTPPEGMDLNDLLRAGAAAA